MERQGDGQHLQHRTRTPRQVGLEADVTQRPRARGKQQRRDRQTQPPRIDQAPAQNPAGRLGPPLADVAGGNHLHAGQQARAGHDDHAGRHPAQRLIADLFRRIMADHDHVRQAHGHDAQARQDHRPGKRQQLAQVAADQGLFSDVGGIGHVSRQGGKKPATMMAPPLLGKGANTTVILGLVPRTHNHGYLWRVALFSR